MGKIVKFCASCEESFAEKFSFCPNCASELSPFEMKPVEDAPIAEESVEEVPTVDLSNDYETTNLEDKKPIIEASESTDPIEEQAVFEPVNFSNENVDESDDILEIEVEEPVKKEEVFVADDVSSTDEASEATTAGMFAADTAEEVRQDSFEPDYSNADNIGDDGFHVTVVSEKGGKVRNGLLLTAFAIVIFGFIGIVVYSLFTNLDDVASLDTDDRLLALIDESSPMETEEQEKKEDKDEGGGGGGGGNERSKPATRGELPNQTRTIQPPPMMTKRMTNPSLAVTPTTQGDNKNRNRTDNIGITNGVLSEEMSSGRGRGGGIGDGIGTGIGNGNGTGEGNGNGSGSGNGNGNGNGDGNGDGDNARRTPPPPPPPPKPKPAGPTTGIQILSKPKPGYTDAARQNNVRGVVRVKVDFLKNGRIGGVSVVKGLPHGLTQLAIAAARQIKFKPPMKNGVPYSTRRTIAYNFTIY